MEQHGNHLMGINYRQCLLRNVQVHQSRDNGKLITAHINLHIKQTGYYSSCSSVEHFQSSLLKRRIVSEPPALGIPPRLSIHPHPPASRQRPISTGNYWCIKKKKTFVFYFDSTSSVCSKLWINMETYVFYL